MWHPFKDREVDFMKIVGLYIEQRTEVESSTRLNFMWVGSLSKQAIIYKLSEGLTHQLVT